jgi:hypothetical protein
MTHFYNQDTIFSATMDDNCYQSSNSVAGISGTSYSSILDFSNAQNVELNAVEVASPPSPLAASGNFSLAIDSSCRNGATTIENVTEDYAGQAFASTPARGALQN